MTQNPTQSSGTSSHSSKSSASSGSGSQPDPNTKLLQEIASLTLAVKQLAERSAPPPVVAEDEAFQRQVDFAYTALGSMLGRGSTFESELHVVEVTRSHRSLTFVDLHGARAARIRARVDDADTVTALDNLTNGTAVTITFDPEYIEGIEILDIPDGAVVALGRLQL